MIFSMADVRFSKISEWLSGFPEEEAEQEVQDLRRDVERVAEQIEELQTVYGQLMLELTKAEQALRFREQLIRETEFATFGVGPRSPLPDGGRARQRKRGKAAAMTIFEEGSPGMALRAADVRDLMVERGWMEADEDLHSIQVALSRLAREGKLERARQGVYRLPAGEEASAPTDVQGTNGGGSEGHGDPRAVTEGHLLALEGAPDEAHRAGS
jgi:hypothetical protein